ncbi:ornithine cyclodeaminase family protein [Jannaschia sp. M317]|uniref:ornithine cyclodeaminase family protein n=1 Tax=Jannaschia sp. M317 TaxID=2867011 RepID=UPI0021A26DD1|nr:ornithine cyclodeaminase [Jannaschia sp. M317]UWQ18181.1 ornithine cyclodeaminase [Jannaschia sp. M317]
MSARIIGPDAESALDWLALTRALAAGHRLPRAEVRDSFLYRGDDTILSRAAWIDGLGALVKTATIFPGNPAAGKPTVGGAVSVFDDTDGSLAAMLDFALVTKWKTAGDSLLAATRLARPDSRRILIVGAGTVAASLHEAYAAAFPQARFAVWSRTPATARAFAEARGIEHAPDLATAVPEADIVTCATMSTTPLLRGDWLRPGQHIDLIGAYRPDMREADDAVLRRATIHVDSRDTTLDHIGELKIPLAAGVIARDAVRADYYDANGMQRTSQEEITLFKNGGGAHLDLMTARYIIDTAG